MNHTLEYLRKKNLLLVEALALVFIGQNDGCTQADFGERYKMCRNQTSQLFTRMIHKGWLRVKQGDRRREAGRPFKKYSLTTSGENIRQHLL